MAILDDIAESMAFSATLQANNTIEALTDDSPARRYAGSFNDVMTDICSASDRSGHPAQYLLDCKTVSGKQTNHSAKAQHC